MYSMMMESKLPHSEYAWVSAEELAAVDWASLSEDSTTMFFAVVDLEYPAELHDRDDPFPFAVERASVPLEDLSPLQMGMFEACGLKEAQVTLPKLIAHLGPRKGYLVHGLTLADWLEKGLRVTRWICGIRFRQEAFLKPYIQDLMRERQRSVHKFEQQARKVRFN